MPFLIGLLVIVALGVAAFNWLENATGLNGNQLAAALVSFSVLMVLGTVWLRGVDAKKARQMEEERERLRLDELRERRASLAARFGDQIAGWIIEGRIWTGMSAEHLQEALGDPVGIDRKETVRISREIWKYGQIGEGRFRNRITLDSGVVTGWTDKGVG